MGAGHRVKSVSMGKFSQEEITALEAGGNQVGCMSTRYRFLANSQSYFSMKQFDCRKRRQYTWQIGVAQGTLDGPQTGEEDLEVLPAVPLQQPSQPVIVADMDTYRQVAWTRYGLQESCNGCGTCHIFIKHSV